ncbi:MAG: metallophosphoesterase [Odoribacter sp.]
MRSSSLIFIVGLIFILLTDMILWLQVKVYLRKKWQLLLYCLHSLIFVVFLICFQFFLLHLKGPETYFWIEKLVGLIFLFYTPKFFFIVFNGIGRFIKIFSKSVGHYVLWFSSIFATFVFMILLYSITLGRYCYKTEIVPVYLNQLPKAFEDFRIIQLSDLHLGSYGKSYPGISRLVKEVNALDPDLIVFTGDMVNNFASEMNPWMKNLKELKARYGKYAITGNHDYGDYTRWSTEEAKQENLKLFFKNMETIGFQMLNNNNVPIIRGMDTLWLAGVENWGNPPFPRYGKLAEAIHLLKKNHFIILLSHDPSHWRAEVLEHNIPLTLSGHTHAMQMGIKIGKKRWSPAQHIYPEYDGLYQENNQFLYVSRGQGYIGFPGRIGLRPAITELILKSVAK